MCGILSIMGETTVKETCSLLELLGHRGQDASGIAWMDSDKGISIKKAAGLPKNLLEHGFQDCNTISALASTRYPTYGKRTAIEELERYAQPFIADTDWGKLVLALNGNITNVTELPYYNENYLSDTELLVDILSKNIEQTRGDIVQSIQNLIGSVDGAYSMVGMWNGMVFAFRDPRGIRPLQIGRRKDGTYICSSETIVLDRAKAKNVENVLPGELIAWRKGCDITRHNLRVERIAHRHCFFEWIYFANPCSSIEGISVYHVRMKLGELLAKEIEKRKHLKIDFIAPVPDTSRIAAQSIAELLNIPVREVILKNRYFSKRVFILNSENARQEAVNMKYNYVQDFIAGKNLLLVDDSIVRGMTAKKVVKELKTRGAKKVYLAITSPPIIRPCYYGIDFATEEELLAGNGASLADLEEMTGVDEIIYQGIGDMYEAIGISDLCMACVDGRYPTSFGKELNAKNHQNGDSGQESSSSVLEKRE
ncbi:MAG: amidophosphoribosyltransferase [Candidatus Hodarchaeales archaeon]